MSTISQVAVGGVALNLANVVYSITTTHGRSSITDGPTASTATLTLYGDPLPTVSLSSSLVIEAYGVKRFTGVVSDLEPAVDAVTGRQYLKVEAIGRLADLSLDPVTPNAWPEETSAARATRILAAASFPSYTTSGDLTVLAKTADPTNALDLLGKLAQDTGAAVFDTPAGDVVFQDIVGRAQRYIKDTWTTAVGTFATATGTWAEQETPALAEPVTIEANAIAWLPTIQQHRGNIVNHVTVAYGSADPQATVLEEDLTSQAAHKTRAVSLATDLATLADATTRAEQIITRLSYPRYELGGVQILVPELDAATRDLAMGLMCGSRVILRGLPDVFPSGDWLGVVEGWSETYTCDEFGNEYQTLNLAVSDPAASYATLQWANVTGTYTWANIDTIPWADAITNDTLAA